MRRLFSISAFALGIAGTTVISSWKGEFIFTWPVSVFIVFQAAVAEVRLGGRRFGSDASRIRGRLIAVVLVVCCVVYFLACRRVSLVFEWVFVCGFAGAIPFALAGWRGFRNRKGWLAWHFLMTVSDKDVEQDAEAVACAIARELNLECKVAPRTAAGQG